MFAMSFLNFVYVLVPLPGRATDLIFMTLVMILFLVSDRWLKLYRRMSICCN